MLGSFPPPVKRWSMQFFYPNMQNDMWRIFGHLYFADRDHFVDTAQRKFRQPQIEAFLRHIGIALYDTATAVNRLQDNASDKFLEVVQETDVSALLRQLPQCRAVVTTGQKATTTLCQHFGLSEPPRLSPGTRAQSRSLRPDAANRRPVAGFRAANKPNGRMIFIEPR